MRPMLSPKCDDKNQIITCKGLEAIKHIHKLAANVELFFGPYGPDWFQEMSPRQMSAADGLCTGLAEDIEEMTVYRTQNCLHVLGIDPMPRPSEIREAITLSQGSDIAFLWFLMELCVTPAAKRGKKKVFSLNERMIFGAICHLDMITTLRGLDAILPPHAKPEPAATPRRKPSRPSETPKKYQSPYLEPLTKLKVPKSRCLPMPPMPGPSFQPYDKYADPKHIVQNEQMRWFGSKEGNLDSKCLILDGYCPTNRSSIERKEYVLNLFDDFVSATRCNCSNGHTLKNTFSDVPVYYVAQLESAKTNPEFIAILKRIMGQTLVKELTTELLFKHHKLQHIHVCINCKLCKKDYDMLKRIRRHIINSKLVIEYGPYFDQIRDSIFGSDGPAGLLKKFDDIATDRGEIVHVCVKDIWRLNLYLWSDCQKSEATSPNCSCFPCNPNPYDSKMMDYMLCLALDCLKNDSKFVIPFLPRAFELPLLQQWIRVRYGIKYTRQDRSLDLRESKGIWKILDNQKPPFNVKVNTPLFVYDRKAVLNYDHLDDIHKCVNKLDSAYKDRLNMALVNDGRRFWPTMSPYLSSPRGPPRELFYAYMPSIKNDSILIR